jgi:hypothetical protein
MVEVTTSRGPREQITRSSRVHNRQPGPMFPAAAGPGVSVTSHGSGLRELCHGTAY